jgi:hypothetical protein
LRDMPVSIGRKVSAFTRAKGFLPVAPSGLGCLGTSTRWTDEPGRPSFERHPARVRDAVAFDSDRLAASPDGLVPSSCEPGADEAGNCVRTDPIDGYKRLLGGAVRTAGEQL